MSVCVRVCVFVRVHVCAFVFLFVLVFVWLFRVCCCLGNCVVVVGCTSVSVVCLVVCLCL